MEPQLNWIQQLIQQHTGLTTYREIRIIEEIMRSYQPTLSHLDGLQIQALAYQAHAEYELMLEANINLDCLVGNI